jgi:hypothetical protein
MAQFAQKSAATAMIRIRKKPPCLRAFQTPDGLNE